MLHNYIEDMKYNVTYTPREPDYTKDRLISFDGRNVLLTADTAPVPPLLTQANPVPKAEELQYLFSFSDVAFFLSRETLAECEGLKYASPFTMWKSDPKWLAFAGVTGFHLAVWYRNNKYCGTCGAVLGHKENERALVCPECKRLVFPNINVAVIVGVRDGERILLTRYAPGAGSQVNYALIAGFVEIGETLEDAVKREVMEEVGLKVKNLTYFDDQPWGFSQSILMGFFCDLDGSDEIVMDRKELSLAVWMNREDMPESDTRVSLTSKMMEAFRRGEDKPGSFED